MSLDPSHPQPIRRLLEGWNLVLATAAAVTLVVCAFLVALDVSVVWFAFACSEGGCSDAAMLLFLAAPLTWVFALASVVLTGTLVYRTPGSRMVTVLVCAGFFLLALGCSGLYWLVSWIPAL